MKRRLLHVREPDPLPPELECSETVELGSGPIKIGSGPIGQRKTGKIATHVGSRARVAYLPGDPPKTTLADNKGLMNKWGECGARGAR